MQQNRDRLFWDKVDIKQDNECWNWLASKTKDGHGQFWIGHTFVGAHRYAYTQCNGEIPNNLSILHTCDNPACCNPDHLYAGTQADNMRDRMVRRTYDTKLNSEFKIKLSSADILKVIELRNQGISQAKIAEYFNCNQSTVSRALRGVNAYANR